MLIAYLLVPVLDILSKPILLYVSHVYFFNKYIHNTNRMYEYSRRKEIKYNYGYWEVSRTLKINYKLRSILSLPRALPLTFEQTFLLKIIELVLCCCGCTVFDGNSWYWPNRMWISECSWAQFRSISAWQWSRVRVRNAKTTCLRQIFTTIIG